VAVDGGDPAYSDPKMALRSALLSRTACRAVFSAVMSITEPT